MSSTANNRKHMYRNAIYRTVLGVIATAALLAACSSATAKGPGLPAENHAELIQGNWIFTSYVVTYSLAPDNPIDVTDYSEITVGINPDTYHYVCFPACLTTVRQEWGSYTIDQAQGTIRQVTTDVDLEPEYEYLRSQAIGEEVLYRYNFESRDVLVLRGKLLVRSGSTLVSADLVARMRRQ